MNFLERIQEQILVGDGAIGTMLYAKGMAGETCFERLNLSDPDLVSGLHADYIAAGAQVIETNTFGANRQRLTAVGLKKRCVPSTCTGRYSPAGQPRDGTSSLPVPSARSPAFAGESDAPAPEEICALFREQAFALVEGGVDLLILETFSDLEQMKIALAAAGETGLPLVASMAFLERGPYTRRHGSGAGGTGTGGGRRCRGRGKLRRRNPGDYPQHPAHGHGHPAAPCRLSQQRISGIRGRPLHLPHHARVFRRQGTGDGSRRRKPGGRLLRHHPGAYQPAGGIPAGDEAGCANY